jgi:hypothetical protein
METSLTRLSATPDTWHTRERDRLVNRSPAPAIGEYTNPIYAIPPGEAETANQSVHTFRQYRAQALSCPTESPSGRRSPRAITHHGEERATVASRAGP